MQNLSLLLKIGFEQYLIGLFFGLTKDNSSSMSPSIKIYDVSDD